MNGEMVSGLKKPVTMMIDSATSRVSGYAGCNQYFSSFTTEGSTVKFSSAGRTKMFCNETMEVEEKFIAALEAVNTFKTEGSTLLLLNGNITLLEFTK